MSELKRHNFQVSSKLRMKGFLGVAGWRRVACTSVEYEVSEGLCCVLFQVSSSQTQKDLWSVRETLGQSIGLGQIYDDVDPENKENI